MSVLTVEIVVVEKVSVYYLRKFVIMSLTKSHLLGDLKEEDLSPGFLDKLLENPNYYSKNENLELSIFERQLIEEYENQIRVFLKNLIIEKLEFINWKDFFKFIQKEEPKHHEKFLTINLFNIWLQIPGKSRYHVSQELFNKALTEYNYRVDGNIFKQAQKDFNLL